MTYEYNVSYVQFIFYARPLFVSSRVSIVLEKSFETVL